MYWSKDHRALVVDGGGDFLIWREGYRLRHFAVPAHTYFDYTMGFVWSPNKRRLLVRFGASASADVDAGTLFSLKLGRGESYKYSVIPASFVRKMAWRNSRTVLYWLMDEKGKTSNKPRAWRAPSLKIWRDKSQFPENSS